MAEYYTTDFGLAVALLTKDVKCLRIEKNKKRQAVMVFGLEDENTIEDYWSGSLSGSLLSYHENTRKLKSRINDMLTKNNA